MRSCTLESNQHGRGRVISGLSVRLPVSTPIVSPASRNAPYFRYFFVASNPAAERIQTAPPFPSSVASALILSCLTYHIAGLFF